MRAAILRRTGSPLEVSEDVTLVPLEPDDVRIKVRATGLCHTDVHGMDGALGPLASMVLGHEGAGEVVETGSAVSTLAVGDHVVLVWSPPCGRCIACVDQRSPHLCTKIQFEQAMRRPFVEGERTLYGMSGIGSFAEEILCTEASCVKIDDDVPWEIGSLIGCAVTTGVGAVFNAAIDQHATRPSFVHRHPLKRGPPARRTTRPHSQRHRIRTTLHGATNDNSTAAPSSTLDPTGIRSSHQFHTR